MSCYVYGPQISAKKLRALESTNEDFFSFMRNDKVLIGILLGFGLENALYVSRAEQIQESIDLIQLLESSNWLKKILSDIFGENVTIIVDHSINSLDLDVRIVVPFQEINFSNLDPLIALSLEKKQCKRIASKEDSKFNDQQELLNRIGQILYDHFIDENPSESLISFIEGMKEADKRKDAHYVAPYAHYIDVEFMVVWPIEKNQ